MRKRYDDNLNKLLYVIIALSLVIPFFISILFDVLIFFIMTVLGFYGISIMYKLSDTFYIINAITNFVAILLTVVGIKKAKEKKKRNEFLIFLVIEVSNCLLSWEKVLA